MLSPADGNLDPLPITAVIVIADRNKCPHGFQPVTKTLDDGNDADVWRESSFSLFSRPTRYIAVSRDLPKTAVGCSSVVTDLCIINGTDPVPHMFVGIEYTADSKEKGLRKRLLCVKSEPMDVVVDAIGEIVVVNKAKKVPRGFSLSGEIDGLFVCHRVVVIPQSFRLSHSASTGQLNDGKSSNASGGVPLRQPGLYPRADGVRHSDNDIRGVPTAVQSLTIRNHDNARPFGIDGVPFHLNSVLSAALNSTNGRGGLAMEPIPFDVARLESEDYSYRFSVERSALSSG